MAESIIIRLATANDIPRILELYNELAITTSEVESNKEPSLRDYKRTLNEIRSIPGYQLLVAEDKGEILGTMVFIIVPNLAHKNCPWAIVEYLIIDQRYQRQNVGRQLMKYAIAEAKKAGCYKIVLSSNKKRKVAHRFYRSLGFEASSHGFSIYF